MGKFFKLRLLIVACMACCGVESAWAQLLISQTDFSCSKKSSADYFASLDEVDGYTGLVEPIMTTSLPLTPDAVYSKTSSTFVDGYYYAITNNPIKLDSFRLYDNNESHWGMLLPICSKQCNLLTYKVYGLKPGSDYTIDVELCYIASYDIKNDVGYPGVQNNAGTISYGSFSPTIKVGANMDGGNVASFSGKDFQLNGNSVGPTHDCVSMKFGPKVSSDASSFGKIGTDGSLTIYINGGTQSKGIMIKNISVHGDIDPIISCLDGEEVCSGEQVVLQLKRQYEGAKYQWYKDGVAIPGANSSSYLYETPNTESKSTFRVDVIVGTTVVSSNDIDIKNIKCCEVNGAPASRKVIYKDDFGEFDLSDKTGHTYKVWDYSDIANPVQLTKTTPDAFRYELSNPPLGCTYNLASGGAIDATKAIEDGGYTVAGVITGYNGAYQGYAGARLEWAADIHGIKNTGIAYDKSGEMQGCALFVNCKDKTQGKNIYEQAITNLCQNRQLFFECSYSVFTADAPGTYNPVDITVRLTELDASGGKTSNSVEATGTATSKLYGGSGDWEKIKIDNFFLSTNDAVLLEIINNINTDQNGNDLVLDDIIIKACASPTIKAFYDLNTLDVDTITCSGEDIVVYAKTSELLKQYYGGEANTYFQYQYSLTPDVKNSWKNYEGLCQDLSKNVSACPIFGSVKDGDIVYFRVIAGGEHAMKNTSEDSFNPDDPCASYSISDAIPCYISCPVCYKSKEIGIKGDKAVYITENDYDVYSLCMGESVTFTTGDVTTTDNAGDPYAGYQISWFKDQQITAEAGYTVSPASTAKAYTVTNSMTGTAPEEHFFYVLTADTFDVKATSCQRWDTVKVIFQPKPAEKLDTLPAFCEGKLTAEPDLTITGYDLHWYDANPSATTTTAPTELSVVPTMGAVLASESPKSYYYVLEDVKTGCLGDANEYVVTVNPIPEEKLDTTLPFCEGDATALLPVSKKGYTVNWYADASKAAKAVTDLSTLKGNATSPYTYYYTLTDESQPTNCESDPYKYEFIVMPKAEIKLDVTYACDVTTLTATTTPTGMDVEWTQGTTGVNNSPLLIDDKTMKAGTYEAKVPAVSGQYCESDPASENIVVYQTPASIGKISMPDYLKADGTPDYSKIDAAVKAKASTDPSVKVYWSAPIGSTTTDESSTMTAPASGYSTSRVDPTPNLSNTDDEFFYYFVYQTLENAYITSCPSDTTIIVVPILGAPSPIVNDTTFCVNSTMAGTLGDNVKINQAKAGVTYKLDWKGGVDENTPIDVSKVGETTYEVAQYDASKPANISSYKSFTIKVVGVEKPTMNSNTLAYCANETPVALNAQIVEDKTNFYADAINWIDENGTDVGATVPTVNTAVTATTTYTYKAYQTYTIPTSGEVCKGDEESIDVNVTYVPELTTTQVTYLKADATGGTFAKDVKTQEPNVYSGEETGATINWYESNGTTCGTSLGSKAPTPTIDPSTPTGKDQTVYYCVSQTVNGCEGPTKVVTVVISDSPMPMVKDVQYCEGETAQPLTADINTLTNPASDYKLNWYDESMSPLSGAPTPSTDMKAGETTVSEYIFYATQTLIKTGAESTPSQIKVTIYANPVLAITAQYPDCETDANLKAGVLVTNQIAGQTYKDTYFSDAAGTSVILPTVSKSGTYYSQYEYTPVAGHVCQSKIEAIDVTIDELTFHGDDVTTCPATSAEFNASATSNVSTITYDWTEISGTDNGTGEKFATRVFTGSKAGDTYKYKLTVSAGKCVKDTTLTVTIGDGPVIGDLTLTDNDNKLKPTEKYINNSTTDPFYFCGNEVEIKPNYTLTTGDYTLTMPSGATTTGTSFKADKAGEYTLTFINKCSTKVNFTMKDASISLTDNSPALEMCEGETFDVSLTVKNADPAYDLTWTKDGNAESRGTQDGKLKIDETVPADGGEYKVLASSHGCEYEHTIGTLKVKPYIQFEPVTPTPAIVVRDKDTTLTLKITTPATGTIATADWMENGTKANSGLTYNITNVQKDHTYEILLSDPDYCDAKATADVWVDAKLQLKANTDDTICYGETHDFVVDTTGTGAFRNGMPLLTVIGTETVSGNKDDISSKLIPDGSLLKADITPLQEIVYRVHYEYNGQKIDTALTVVVLQPITFDVPAPQIVCEGEEVTIKIENIAPAGTTIEWTSNATIQSVLDEDSITVISKFPGGATHRENFRYPFKLNFSICQTIDTAAYLTVDEPLSGKITGDDPICENAFVTLDASTYEAETYHWEQSDGTGMQSGAKISVRMPHSATYMLSMTRGECEAQDQYDVDVRSNPLILGVDSTDIRTRVINIDESKGTMPITYSIDGQPADESRIKENLKFITHTVYAVDAVGCADTLVFTMDPPGITIPDYFSPNGDTDNDTWIPANLKEVYPEALVMIFDRFGKKLAEYHAGDDTDWDGTYQGEPMPSTDYWYEIDIEEIDKQYVGHFTLLRR